MNQQPRFRNRIDPEHTLKCRNVIASFVIRYRNGPAEVTRSRWTPLRVHVRGGHEPTGNNRKEGNE